MVETTLPYWLQVLQALATPAIAILGLTIAWAQWHTARLKLVLDLFNQRMEIYRALGKVIGPVLAEGTADIRAIVAFSRPQDEARFLFGSKVNNYLEEIRKALADLGYCHSMLSAEQSGEERQKTIELQHKQLTRVSKFYDEFGALIAPYVRMDQKRP